MISLAERAELVQRFPTPGHFLHSQDKQYPGLRQISPHESHDQWGNHLEEQTGVNGFNPREVNKMTPRDSSTAFPSHRRIVLFTLGPCLVCIRMSLSVGSDNNASRLRTTKTPVQFCFSIVDQGEDTLFVCWRRFLSYHSSIPPTSEYSGNCNPVSLS